MLDTFVVWGNIFTTLSLHRGRKFEASATCVQYAVFYFTHTVVASQSIGSTPVWSKKNIRTHVDRYLAFRR